MLIALVTPPGLSSEPMPVSCLYLFLSVLGQEMFFYLQIRCWVTITCLSPGSDVHYVLPLLPLLFPRHLQMATIRASCKIGRRFGLTPYRIFIQQMQHSAELYYQ